jgi:hypothetical protein
MIHEPHPIEVSKSHSGDRKDLPLTVTEFAQRLGLAVGGWLAEQAVEVDSPARKSLPARSHRC